MNSDNVKTRHASNNAFNPLSVQEVNAHRI